MKLLVCGVLLPSDVQWWERYTSLGVGCETERKEEMRDREKETRRTRPKEEDNRNKVY